MLRTFALEGIVDLDRLVERDQISEAALIVDQAFTGMFPDLLFTPTAPVGEPIAWRPELTEQSMAALDPHMISRKIRDLLLDRAITDFLSLIFAARPRLTASRIVCAKRRHPIGTWHGTPTRCRCSSWP